LSSSLNRINKDKDNKNRISRGPDPLILNEVKELANKKIPIQKGRITFAK
jgi:hypothetical protein